MPTTTEPTDNQRHCAAPQTSACEGLCKGLFDHSPISLREEDASEVKAYLDRLKRSGIHDIRTYLEYHPEEVAKCAGMVKVTAVNAATVELYEAEDAASLLANLDKVLCEESYDALKQALVAIAEGETRFEADAFNRTLKGKKKHLRMRWSVAPGYESTYQRLWISMLDLTEHEFFAKELDDTDRRYRVFAEYVNDVIWIMDMGLNFTYVSPSVERSLGYSTEEILGMHYRDLLTPASLEVAMAAVAEELAPEAMRNRDPRRSRVLELEFITKEGSTLWGELNISFMHDKDNIPTGIVGVIRDVTDRHVAGEALERSWQAQKVVNDLLQISLSDISRDEMLRRMISHIVNVPLFSPNALGAILLRDPGSDTLVMKVESGLAGESVAACARRRLGECLCGAAAATGEIMYRAGGEEPSGRQCQVARERSQYCVPFASTGKPVGVLNLYLDKAHTCCEKEMEFLSAVGRVLASSIERKQAVDTLRKSEASYRAVFDMAGDSILIHDAETARILDVNDRACELFGYSHTEMLTLDVASISAGDSAFSQEEAVKRVKRAPAEGPQLFEWHCRDSAGRLFWAEVNLSYARLGSGDRVLAFVRDIDSRKQAEQRVLQLSRLLEGITDTVDMWVSAADADGKILVWNAAAEAISGYSREEVIGSNNVWKLMYPEASIREKYMAERWAALRSGVKCDRHRTSIVTGRGESRWICWDYYPLSDGAGNLCGAVALAFDVTDAAGEGDSAPDLAGHAPRVKMKDIS